MKWRSLLALTGGLVAAAALLGVAVAVLTDSQTATGTITATSTSADLYICEPGVPGPACGSDDSGADEIVFETIEDISPGETVEWDIRLQNVGTTDWILSDVTVTIVETLDPGSDCPDAALVTGRDQINVNSSAGAFILGKAGDVFNDNPAPGGSFFLMAWGTNSPRGVFVAAGDYEDIRLRIELPTAGTENCDGNEWSLTYVFDAG